MKARRLFLVTCLSLLAIGCLTRKQAHADTFGSGGNVFDIPFVSIGDPGNAPGAIFAGGLVGSVDYEYRIGKYEISEAMIDAVNAITADAGDPLGLTHDVRGPNKPATSVSWFEAAQFVNWLNEEKGHTPAYKLDGAGDFQLWKPGDVGYNPANLFRNSQSRYFLPSADEWHKAAYYDPDANVYYNYPTGSNTVPDGMDFAGDPIFDAVFWDNGGSSHPNDITDVGILSPYGTAGQGGNVFEWEETEGDLVNDSISSNRGYRGGSWRRGPPLSLASIRSGGVPSSEDNLVGFRVASIPEPSTFWLISSLVGLFFLRRPYSKRLSFPSNR